MHVHIGRYVAFYALKHGRKLVLDSYFPKRTYKQWLRDLGNCERAVFEAELKDQGNGKVVRFLEFVAKKIPDAMLRKSIEEAVNLESALMLPDSDNLVSKRLNKLQILKAKLQTARNTNITLLEDQTNPYYGFFTHQEMDRLRSKFNQPLPNVKEDLVREECFQIIRDRNVPQVYH